MLHIHDNWFDLNVHSSMKHQGYKSNHLCKHHLGKGKAAWTSLDDKLDLTRGNMRQDGSDEQQQMVRHYYRGLVSSIACLSLTSRLDLAFPAQLLSRFLCNPRFAQGQAAKQVLHYLRGTARRASLWWRQWYRPNRVHRLWQCQLPLPGR